MVDYRMVPLKESVEEMFIGPFGSSLKNDCFVGKDKAFCMVYEQKHAIQKTMDVETRYVDEKKYLELKRFNIQGGDIIVSCRGTIGETFIVPDNAPLGIMHPSIMKIRLKEGVYDKDYFNALLQMRLKKHEAEANGSGVKMAISATELGNELFPLPAINEQKRISNILSKVRKVIDERCREICAFDELIKARFVELFGDPVVNQFGWAQTSLKNVAQGKLSYGSGASAIDFDGSIRYVRITDINETGELDSDSKSPDKYDDKYLLHDGDILFARSGATVGKTFRYNQEKHGKCIYAGYLIRLVPDISKVLPDYVYWYTKTSYYSSFVEKVQRAVAQPNINAQEYGSLTICVPPLDVQERLVGFIKQVDKSKAVIQKSLDKTQLLLDSLMQKYFA